MSNLRWLRSVSESYRANKEWLTMNKPIQCSTCGGLGGWDIAPRYIDEHYGFLGLRKRTHHVGWERERCFQCDGLGVVDPWTGKALKQTP